jgi:hypothetical protein
VLVYARAGFTVQTILIDNEFEKVWDHESEVNMSTPAARVIKEQAQGIICTLLYKTFPQLMLIHLLHFIVMWLNKFPVANVS